MGLDKRILSSSVSDTWDTPADLFAKLHAEFSFTLDPCCQEYSAKCPIYYTPQEDGLKQSWSGHTVFMNPPYGRTIRKWVQKAFNESKEGALVVCLLPSRTDTSWWHEYCMKGEVRFLRGRLKFENRSLPSWREDGSHKMSPAPFPSAIVVFRP